MNVTNCKECGRLFNPLGNENICPDCKKMHDDKFHQVKVFLDENPNATVEIVSKEMEVSTKQIRQWIREERLVFSEGSFEGIECESCGKLIKTGRYCDQCKANLANTLSNALDKPKMPVQKKRERDGNKMRFLK